MIKSLIVAGLAAGTLVGTATTAEAHTVPAPRSTAVTYAVTPLADGAAKITRRVWVGKRVTATATVVTAEGAMIAGTCSRITIGQHAPAWDGGAHRPGMSRDVSGLSCPGKRTTLSSVRVATDDDVEGEVY
jgi:hypothetical protein